MPGAIEELYNAVENMEKKESYLIKKIMESDAENARLKAQLEAAEKEITQLNQALSKIESTKLRYTSGCARLKRKPRWNTCDCGLEKIHAIAFKALHSDYDYDEKLKAKKETT